MKRVEKNVLIGTGIEIARVERKLHKKGLYKVYVTEGLYKLGNYYKIGIYKDWVVTVKV